mgnify:CR=1 FL=1
MLIVNSVDTNGGAARAVYKLKKVLLEEKIGDMILQNKYTNDYTVLSPNAKILDFLLN